MTTIINTDPPPQTTFAPCGNPFTLPVTVRRKAPPNKPAVQKILEVIRSMPGVTTSDLISVTKNTAAGEYAKALLDAGDVVAIYKRTSNMHCRRGVRHFYPADGQGLA